MQPVGAYAWPLPLAVLSAAGGIVLLLLGCRCATACRLDISPVGQLRVAVYLKLPALNRAVPKFAVPQALVAARVSSPPAWLLLPRSTLWPALLVLRLADGQGRQLAVLVRRGAHGCPDFRSLAVACRVMASHKGQGRQQKVT